MRPFEMFLLLACAVWLCRFAAVARPESPWPLLIQVLVGILLVLQILCEGWRWQMFPLYAVAVLVATGAPAAVLDTPGIRLCFAAAALASAGTSVLAALVFQHLSIPRPSGPSLVGVTTLASLTRTQPTAAPAAGEVVSLPLVQLWYPAAPRPLLQRVSKFLHERVAQRLKKSDSVPAATDPPVVPGNAQFPVLVYFGGWPEDSLQNRSLICELVSRGFVVATFQYPAQPWRPLLNYGSDAAFKHTIELDNERARTFARDASATLDQLAALNNDHPDRRFAHRLNLERTGILGYSFGGAVAAQATRMDPRFKIAVNLDGRHWAEALQSGVAVPYLFVGEELLMPTRSMLTATDPTTRYEAQMDQIDYTKLAANLRANGGIQVTIDGVTHINFSDDVLRSPVRRISGGGAIDAQRGLFIVNSLVAEFFAHHLSQQGKVLLAGNPRPFPEARAAYWPAPNRR